MGDLSGNGAPDLLIRQDTRTSANDWAFGLEGSFEKGDYRKYAQNDYFLFRYDVQLLPDERKVASSKHRH